MPLALNMVVGYQPTALHHAGGGEHQRPGDSTLAAKHKDKRDPKDWKGFKFAVPFDYSMHIIFCAIISPSTVLDTDVDVQIRAVPHRKWSPICAPDNIDGFLGPDPMNPARGL